MPLAYSFHAISYEYRSFNHILCTEDAMSFPAYGVEVYRHDTSGCTMIDSIPGITTRHEKIERLLDLLNRAQVSPIHFRDTVEDFLS